MFLSLSFFRDYAGVKTCCSDIPGLLWFSGGFGVRMVGEGGGRGGFSAILGRPGCVCVCGRRMAT